MKSMPADALPAKCLEFRSIISDMNALKVPSTPHSFRDGQGAWNQGKYGFWPTWKYVYSMGYFKREEIPFQFQLAEAFTLCDAYHCSVTGGSDPNRTVIFAGTNVNPEKVKAGLRTGDQDGEPDNGRCAVDNADPNVPDPALPPPGYRFNGAQFPFPPFKFPTIPEVLEKAGISWRIYQDPCVSGSGSTTTARLPRHSRIGKWGIASCGILRLHTDCRQII